MPESRSIRLAVAQTTLCDDPRNAVRLRESGLEMRRLMVAAHQAGAGLVHFPEGTICSPNKRLVSASGPARIGPSDWTLVDWTILQEELEAVRSSARELGLWVVFGSVHPLTQPRRPHNSLYVISDRGEIATRYDERMLSNTKVSYMYTPGSIPVAFEVGGIRFGCALGMECHFPEIFTEYERLDVDCVLFSSTGGSVANGPAFAVETQGHAASNSYWVSFAVHAHAGAVSSGVVAPDGRWAASCPSDGNTALAVLDIGNNAGDIARPWRRLARGGVYIPLLAHEDERSENRSRF